MPAYELSPENDRATVDCGPGQGIQGLPPKERKAGFLISISHVFPVDQPRFRELANVGFMAITNRLLERGGSSFSIAPSSIENDIVSRVHRTRGPEQRGNQSRPFLQSFAL